MQGRYVGVRLPGPRVLTLCEVQVFSPFSPAPCPQDNRIILSSGKTYTVPEGNSTYGGAQEECRRQGGIVAIPRNGEEQQNLAFLKNCVSRDAQFWLGIRKTAGVWIDDRGTALGSFTSWASGEPDNRVGCAHIVYGNKVGERRDKWADADCLQLFRYVCEIQDETCGLSAFRHVPRTGCPGSDISSPPGVTLQDCAEACCADSTCLSFQYKINNQCYMKSRLCSDEEKVSTSAGNMYDRILIPGYTKACQVVTSGSGGEVQNPQYPAPTDVSCEGLVTVARGKRVELTFSSFSVEYDEDCGHDYVELFDTVDKSWKSLGKFCGSTPPDVICSVGSAVKIVFHTDPAVPSSFSVTWKPKDATFGNEPCNAPYVAEAITCPPLMAPTNGTMTTGQSNSYQDEAQFTCDAGFILEGAPSVSCRADGRWTSVLPTCSPCQSPLGMESRDIPDSDVTASSFTTGEQHSSYYGRLNGVLGAHAWCAGHLARGQWLQVDLGVVAVTGVTTQGRGQSLYNQWVTSYTLHFSWDGTTFTPYKNQDLSDKVFDGNSDRTTPVTHLLDSPVVTKHVRFVAETWHGYICMRVEVLGCKDIAACLEPMGMEDGSIPDSSITASSVYDINHKTYHGRLNTLEGRTAWVASITLEAGQWLQVDLGGTSVVHGVITQGRDTHDQWVTSYKLQHSRSGRSWTTYTDTDGSDKIFTGNTDRRTPVTHILRPPVAAQYVRFVVQTWVLHISMRVEVLGCREEGCSSPLGMESRHILDESITTSSTHQSCPKPQSRLNSESAWCALSNTASEWLQIDLGMAIVSGVITQGRANSYQWVTSYKLQFNTGSAHGIWTTYQDDEGFDTVFTSNTDRTTPVRHMLQSPVTTRYVRIVPVTWHRWISMRVEVMGCYHVALGPRGSAFLPEDCQDIHLSGPDLPSGPYTVYPRDRQEALLVYCDLDTDGGGWTVFQRRQDGSVDFYLDWKSYKKGFPLGSVSGEFWLGNDNLHRLTTQKAYELRVDLEAVDGATAYAVYDSFSVGDESDKYRLVVGGYSGTAGDSMAWHNGMSFSTKDGNRDHDVSGSHCAVQYTGAWWYNDCHHANLNGAYGDNTYGKGVNWVDFKGPEESLKFTEMKIRPKA
ncbi:uncharacterized protein LOC144879090 [Branchiostoma floridae x Branchiostoma japonicum]